jgi:hypothetical protein
MVNSADMTYQFTQQRVNKNAFSCKANIHPSTQVTLPAEMIIVDMANQAILCKDSHR